MAPNSLADNATASAPNGIRLQLFGELCALLVERREPQALLDLATRGTRHLLGAAYAVLAATDSTGKAAYSSFSGSAAAPLPPPSLEAGWLGEIHAAGQPRRLSVTGGRPERIGLPPQYPQIYEALAAPLTTSEGARGWICLAARAGNPGFNADDERLLALLGAQLGRLLEQAEAQQHLLERAQRLQVEAEEREHSGHTMLRMLQRLEALRALGIEILAARSTRDLVRIGLEHLAHLVPYWGASVTMLEPTGHGVVVLADIAAGPTSHYAPGRYMTLAQYGTRDLEVLRDGRILDIPDISAGDAPPPVVKTLYRQGMRSYARIPMMVEGVLVGSLNLGSDKTFHFTAEQLDFARSIANQIGIAAQQAALRERIARQAAELERRVEERTAELAAANEDLEAFSFTVSHDLRAPLRAIDGFSRMLEEDYGGALDEKGHRLLGTIRGNSQRMAALIDDLLKFAKLGRARISPTQLDMASLVREAWQQIGAEANAAAALRLGDLPPSYGDVALLRQVWANLLENACKYSSKRGQPIVEVSARAETDAVVYCVADNGAGFDMRYYEKLFGVFQRLHSTQEFPGTGVGLAMVHRVVNRHGGRVWAESVLGEGARFFFSLPRQSGAPSP
ncbi:MAG TPA: ATP-binding protein [Burkholderiales bacterium]